MRNTYTKRKDREVPRTRGCPWSFSESSNNVHGSTAVLNLDVDEIASPCQPKPTLLLYI
jgi:hypothetical protein